MRKKIVLGLSIFILLIAVLLIAALEPVDYTPYFFTTYYKQTRRRIDSAFAAVKPVTGPLSAGFGRAPVVSALPPASNGDALPPIPLAGYSARQGKPATGIHDSLWIKAAALRVQHHAVVLVSWDGLIFPQEVAEGVVQKTAAEFGLQRSQILFSATHSHSSIGGWGEGFLAEQFAGEYQPEVRRGLITQTTAAIRAALADLSPARLAVGRFHAPQFVRNRLVRELGRVDDEFTFVALQQADGDMGILGTFAAHATVLSSENMQMSGDWPGYWQGKLETKMPGTAIFFAGGVGSHRPAGPGSGFDRARFIGESLADSVLRKIAGLHFAATITLASWGVPVELPEHHVRISDGVRLRPYLARKLVPLRQTYLQLVRIGNLLWAGAPCDFSGELALDLKYFARDRGFEAIVTSFNGSYVGYVIPGKYYHFNSYESRLMSFFGPYMGDYFEELIRRSMTRAMKSTSFASALAR